MLSFIHLPFPSSLVPTVPTFCTYWRQVLGYLMRHIAGNGMAFRWSPSEITSFCGFCCLEMFSWWAASVPVPRHPTYIYDLFWIFGVFSSWLRINLFDLHITNRYRTVPYGLVFKLFSQCIVLTRRTGSWCWQLNIYTFIFFFFRLGCCLTK